MRAAEGLSRAFGTQRLDGLAREAAGLAHRLDRAFGPRSVDGLIGAVDGLGRRLDKSGRGSADGAAQRLAVLETALRGLDPEGPLERGYALVRVAGTGEFLRDPRRVTKGEALDITVRDGRVAATVTDTRPNEE